MESGSVLSEPSGGNRGFAAERSVSMVWMKVYEFSFQQQRKNARELNAFY